MIIDFEKITALKGAPPAKKGEVLSILKDAGRAKGLGLEESNLLLSIEDKGLLQALYKKAGEVKERLFGKRVVLFAPLYLSNYCTNSCVYCGFRGPNRDVQRKALSMEEVVSEARRLESMGFKRVLLVTGEDPRWGVDYIVSAIKVVYENTGMRIVHLNAPPMDKESFREIKKAGAGVYQAFQETYHRDTYKVMHPLGRKSGFDLRLSVMDRAVGAGFRDVGIGPLLGLYDYRFDCLCTIAHSKHLYGEFGAHAHTISVPRLRPAAGSGLKEIPAPVTETELKKIVAVFRLAVPTAGVVVSTREPAGLRSALVHSGASQMSAASRTDPGGYAVNTKQKPSLEQFSTNDHRSLAEVMKSIIDEGFVPSLCTTCYRVGRTGAEFTDKTASGSMEKFCSANAALTLKEFLTDYSKNGMKGSIEKAIKLSLKEIKDPVMRKAVQERLKEIEDGGRDIFF